MNGTRRVVAFSFVLLLLAIVARSIVPFSTADKRVLVPPDRYLDATLATLLVADGVDRLLTNPRTFYDTAILYPDRTQLRSTEPFLGFALMALPLRTVGRVADADMFELLRWLIVFGSLVYAYLLFRAAGVEAAIATAGAAVCLAQPNLLIGISRLQVLSIPLILPVLFHAVMVWSGRAPRVGHSLALFFWTALYPLCGAINATVAVAAGVILLPLIARMCLDLSQQRRLLHLMAPVLAAVAVDAVVLTPWLFDRADMAVYTTPAFLAIKRWTPTFVPLRAAQVPSFIDAPVGPGLAVALCVLVALLLTRRVWSSGTEARESSKPPRNGGSRIWIVPVLAIAMAIAAAYGFTRQEIRWLGVLFDLGCFATLLAYWRAQWRVAAPGNPDDFLRLLVFISAGLGVFLCLMSFGPVAVSNGHALASTITNVLLEAVPPMKAVREFDRLWIFGILFLSIYAVASVGGLLRRRRPLVHAVVATVMLVAVFAAVNSRPLVASPAIEAPRDFVAAAARSPRTGPLYVHPYMKWNARSGVLMIAIARELRRPVVNGYLGVVLPWVAYATNVLQRYPDPEAVWLLQKWRVETVAAIAGDVSSVRLEQLSTPIRPEELVITELPAAADLSHPSALPADTAQERVEASWAQVERESISVFSVKAPGSFAVRRVELHFSPTPASAVPAVIDVYGVDGPARVRLNDGLSGQWLESLTAVALVRREAPVASIALLRPASGELELEWRGKAIPPIDRIILVGEYR